MIARQEGKVLFQWKHLDNGLLHEIWIDSLHRGENPKAIEIVIDEKALALKEKPENCRVLLPSVGDFKLLKVEPADADHKYVRLLFSDPVIRQQYLDAVSVSDQLALVRLALGHRPSNDVSMN